MNTDYRAARIQGKRNEKFEDQDVFNIFSKAATEDEGLVYLNVFKLIFFFKYPTTKTITQSLLLDFVRGKFDKVKDFKFENLGKLRIFWSSFCCIP